MSKQDYIIPIFIPHLGCPHDCVFCNQEEITGKRNRVKPADVEEIIDEYLTTITKTARRIEVAFYGGSFTALDKNYRQGLLKRAAQRVSAGQLTGIRLSTRPDYIDKEELNFLASYKVRTIELGVQSLFDQALKESGRGHRAQDTVTASKLIKQHDFKLGLQIMPGLPGSSKQLDLATGRQIVKLAPDFVRIYPTLVVKNTELALRYRQGDYEPLSLSEAVELSAGLLKLFRQAEIPVIRIGLQPSEEVSKEEIIAGPFHPAFRQLVESKLMLEKIEAELTAAPLELEAKDELILKVNPRDISVARGQKNKNVKLLQSKYNLAQIEVVAESKLARGQVVVK
jgi:histone acetyltransferase (RNA polymerase elongator complex component)